MAEEYRRQRRRLRCCHHPTDHHDHSPSTRDTRHVNATTTTMSHTFLHSALHSSTSTTIQPHSSTKLFSHSHKQRHQFTQTKTHQRDLARHIIEEQQHFRTKVTSLTNWITHSIKATYGFLPSPSLSTHMNAKYTLASTHPSSFFPQINKLAFHDLTTDNRLPPMAHHLLGLGLKFIPKPTYTSTTAAIEQTASKLEQDIGIKTFFAGDNDDSSTMNTLHVKNLLWRPPLPPTDIDT